MWIYVLNKTYTYKYIQIYIQQSWVDKPRIDLLMILQALQRFFHEGI